MARLEKDHEHRSLVTNALRERDDTHGAERRALEDALAADHARDLAARSAAHDAAFGTLAAQHDARLAEHAAQQALHLQQALEAARRERDLDNDEKLAVALRDRDEAHEIEKDELDLFLMCKSERELDARSSAYDRELASKDEQFRALEAELRADREHFASQLAELEARHTAEMEERMAELEESHFEAMNEAVRSVAADKDRERDISLSSRTQQLTERHREELELAAERHDATMASVAFAELMLFCWRIHLCFLGGGGGSVFAGAARDRVLRRRRPTYRPARRPAPEPRNRARHVDGQIQQRPGPSSSW